jgi:DNA-binding winged helix-turn-helix (wHTH) protein/dipeptidyl aminopeptidase/acylaminoacyl peptidase
MRIGDWTVIPSQNVIERDGASVKLEPRAMDLLVYLASSGGRVVSPDELLRDVWHGRVFDEGLVYKKINQLRKALGDDSHHSRFIETIPKRGYRLSAQIVREVEASASEPPGAAAVVPAPLVPVVAVDAKPLSRPGFRHPIAVAALVAAVAMAVVFAGLALRDEQGPPSGEPLQFTPLSLLREGSEVLHDSTSVIWSPDSQAFAFASRDRRLAVLPQVYIRRLDSPTPFPLTRMPFSGTPKAWTRNGRILMSAGLEASARFSGGLWVVPAIGGQPEPVLEVPEGTTNVMTISADGSTFAALRRDEAGVWGVWTATLPRGVPQRYEPAPFAVRSFVNAPKLSFSPDGRQLLLMLNPEARGEEAWLMPYPADAARPPRLVLEGLPLAATPPFSWLPDNRHIILSTLGDGRPSRLYVADTVSGRFRALLDGASTAWQIAPVVSPDGKRLIFTELSADFDIVTLDVRTAEVSPLIATSGVEETPAWAAHVPSLVYLTLRLDQSEIWLRDAMGEDRPIVTDQDFPPGTTWRFLAPQLSPDGSRVIYLRVEADATGAGTYGYLWMSSVAGGAPVRLTDGSTREASGSWSPDGNAYVYTEVSREGKRAIKVARTSGQSAPSILVADAPSTAFLPVWSPDGSWVLYDDDGLKLISVESGAIRDLKIKGALCTFARDEPLLYCITQFYDEARFAVVDFDGSERVVGSFARENRPAVGSSPALHLSLTPDGQGVTYSVNRNRMRLLLVDGLDSVALP